MSCPTCNRKWKHTLFPITEQRLTAPVVGDEELETALLMDPFGTESPIEHFEFDDLGQVQALHDSQIGYETIVTCGLDRESLRSSRHEKAVRAFGLLRKLWGSATLDETTQILAEFHDLGSAKWIHSGMVRCIFVQNTGMSWDALEKAMILDT